MSLGSELWRISVNGMGRSVTRQRAKFLTVYREQLNPKLDCEDYAEDSQKAESPGIKIAIKLNVSKYPVTLRGKCDS